MLKVLTQILTHETFQMQKLLKLDMYGLPVDLVDREMEVVQSVGSSQRKV